MRTETKVQAVIAIILILVMGGAILLLVRFRDQKAPEDNGTGISLFMNEGESYSVLSFLKEKEEGKPHDLLIRLPAEMDHSAITYENDPEGKVFSISIPGLREDYFRDFFIEGDKERLLDISFEFNESRSLIKLLFNDFTCVEPSREENFLCLDYKAPSDYYEKIVVLDAGEGGMETGAVVFGCVEKDINLSIMMKLREAFSEETASRRIGIYCTRKNDAYVKSEDRVAFAKALDADLFLSIHMSSTSSGRQSDFSGTRVLYRVTDETGLSKAFSTLCLSSLVEALSSKDRGVVAGDEDYLVRESDMPVALCEIGYMTNMDELSKLMDNEYQEKAAWALHDAVVEMLSGEMHDE